MVVLFPEEPQCDEDYEADEDGPLVSRGLPEVGELLSHYVLDAFVPLLVGLDCNVIC